MTHRRPTHRLILAAAALTLSTVTGCVTVHEPFAFDALELGEPQREAAAENPRTMLEPISNRLDSPYLPENSKNGMLDTEAVEEIGNPALADVPEVALPLRECVQRAVINNLDVQVAGFDPAIEETRVIEADARFDPVAFAELQWQRNESESNFPTFGGGIGGAASTTKDETINVIGAVGVRQLLRSGGQMEFRFQETYTDTESTSPTALALGTFFQSDISLRLTQPLLRDFGRAVNEARIVINRNNQRISVLDFRASVEDIVSNVEETYWRLGQAVEEVEIAEELLQRTIDTATILYQRQDQDVTRVQIMQALAQVQSREAQLTDARRQVRDLSDQLKVLMNDPSLPVAGPTLVLPASEPTTQPLTFDFVDLIESGLLHRPELGQQQLRVSSAGIALGVAESNLLPRLDLVLSAGLLGLGEGADDAFDDIVEFENSQFGAGIQYEIPIGNREARAIYTRAHLQRQQAIVQYRSLIERITFEIKIAQRDIITSFTLIGSQRQSRLAAAEALRALEEREDTGEPRTPAFINTKLQAQADLANAQRAEAQAIADYNIAISGLEQAKGTLLRYNNILLDEMDGTAITGLREVKYPRQP
ncbi:MAG: TolC family protein [Planctomycetota bacterium]